GRTQHPPRQAPPALRVADCGEAVSGAGRGDPGAGFAGCLQRSPLSELEYRVLRAGRRERFRVQRQLRNRMQRIVLDAARSLRLVRRSEAVVPLTSEERPSSAVSEPAPQAWR